MDLRALDDKRSVMALFNDFVDAIDAPWSAYIRSLQVFRQQRLARLLEAIEYEGERRRCLALIQ